MIYNNNRTLSIFLGFWLLINTITFDINLEIIPIHNIEFNSNKICGGDALNNPPVLSDGGVTPTSGDEYTLFVFSVIYTDINDDEPSFIHVNIDGVGHEMVFTFENFSSGSLYSYNTSLNVGNHTYYFQASDGEDICQYPENNFLEILVDPPGLSDIIVIWGPIAAIAISLMVYFVYLVRKTRK